MPTPEEAFVDAWLIEHQLDHFSYDDGTSDDLVFDWVRQQGPEDWHRYATGFNWDSGTEIARWIIDQPGCDKGTALYLYYAASPGFYAQYPSIEAARAAYIDEEAVELMTAICANWAAGRYTAYRFNPDWVFGDTMPADAEARLALANSLFWAVPEDMARAGSEGVEPEGDSAEGLPPALDAAIRARFEPWEAYQRRSGAPPDA